MTLSRPESRIQVLVVDDHPIVRRGLVDLLGEQDDMAVCGEAATVATALALVSATRPQVVIVDLWLGVESGLDLVTTLATAHPGVRSLVLSAHDERLYADRALAAGASGYIMKEQAASELLAAVRRVAAGKTYVSGEVADSILAGLSGRHRPDANPSVSRLTDRERQVLMLVGRGLRTSDIAQQLTLSVKTVESHYAHLKQKLGLRNGRELTRFAVSWAEGWPS